jgi:hypothetical protein
MVLFTYLDGRYSTHV